MSTQDEETELDRLVSEYLYDEIASELENDSMYKNVWEYGDNGTQTSVKWLDKASVALKQLISKREQSIKEQAEDKGFKEGQRVGQYQAADRLYSHVTTMWLFKDDLQDPKLQMPERADNLLKDCEKYLNHTRKVYSDYLRSDRYRRLHSTNNSLEEK